jgi:hypothetical protein
MAIARWTVEQMRHEVVRLKKRRRAALILDVATPSSTAVS